MEQKGFCWLDFVTKLSPVWKKAEFIHDPALEWRADQKKTDVSVNLIAMLRIPNYAIISHTKDSQQHKLTFISSSASWCCVNKSSSMFALTLAVWRHCSSVLLSVFSVVFCKLVFLFLFFFHFVNMIIFFFFVSFGEKGKQFWRNHFGS